MENEKGSKRNRRLTLDSKLHVLSYQITWKHIYQRRYIYIYTHRFACGGSDLSNAKFVKRLITARYVGSQARSAVLSRAGTTRARCALALLELFTKHENNTVLLRLKVAL